MKIAIPTNGKKCLKGQVGKHFGRMSNFMIIDSETLEIALMKNTNELLGGCTYCPEMLKQNSIEAVFCESIGGRCLGDLREHGIQVFLGVKGTVSEALESFRKGQMTESGPAGCKQNGAGEMCTKSQRCKINAHT
jgi:predicted Fe-Mo cluster-binding NifX family protein